jgi:hypothetical protein
MDCPPQDKFIYFMIHGIVIKNTDKEVLAEEILINKLFKIVSI